MKKIFTLLIMGLCVAAYPTLAQDKFAFVDENGTVLANDATVVRTTVEQGAEGEDVIYSGISVKNVGASASDYLKVHYEVIQLDNGTYQICFPMTCNMQTATGVYETSPGQLMGDLQDIQSEWFPTADGSCIVKLTIETLTRKPGFPPSYETTGYGPALTIEFVKGGVPEPVTGDVNGDGEVNITDVNAIIDVILSPGTVTSNADVTNDGEVNITDVNAVIDIILSAN